jgi:hypothetical protein
MTGQLWYGYLDEAGDVAPFGGSRCLVVAVLLTLDPRPIELHIKRARKTLGRKAKVDEMKATAVETSVTLRLLQALIDEEIEILTTVVDKRNIRRPPVDPEDIYRELVTRTIRRCLERHPEIELWLDKRYTKPALRRLLEKTVREQVVDIPQQVLLIHQEDSQQHRGLQAVDHVAWALYQKHERNDDRLYQVIKEKIVSEEVILRSLW